MYRREDDSSWDEGAPVHERGAPASRRLDAAPRPRVLLASAGAEIGHDLVSVLDRRGYATATVTSAAEAIDRVARDEVRLLVLVLPLPDGGGRTVIDRVRRLDRHLPFLVAGQDADVTSAADAIELGAEDYLALPLADPADFLETVGVIIGSRRGDQHLRYLHTKDAPAGWHSVVGDSAPLRQLVDVFRQLSKRTERGSTPTILLTGETGTGKGFIARNFHYNSVRRNRPFVDVNCAAIPPSLMETELFGYERGTFTDAKSGRDGLFHTANTGTLFLDEIASVSLDLQAKLLTAIEEKSVRRIGGRRSTRVDVQIIAATHEDLAQRVKERAFREDLYHRLNVVALTVPALRDRGSDVVLLAERFLAESCKSYGMPIRRLGDDARAWLKTYHWPGNVRELRNQIERIVLLENDEVLRPQHFRGADSAPSAQIGAGAGGGEIAISLPDQGVPLAELERAILSEALARCGGNVSRAARFLSISRQKLMYRLKKHGIGASDGA